MILALALCILPVASGFYLPGVTPYSYADGENIELKVNKLSSVHTQIPYDYYSLKYCRPEDGIKKFAENLGEFLTGDRILNSPYDISMKKDEFCKVLCQVDLSTKEANDFKKAIKNQYHNNWIIDNLPAASIVDTAQLVNYQYIGFPYHSVDDGHRIVGFYVEPLSIKHTLNAPWNGKGTAPPLTSCPSNKHVHYESIKDHQKVSSDGKLIFSYGVEWRPSDIVWASRWDVYLSMNHAVPDKVHWFSIVNSVLIVVFLAFMVAMILVRTLNKDINKYNKVMTDEEKADEREESGWKLVHADVFRPPTEYAMLFCVMFGSGVQILVCAFFLILFAALGFLSPSNRGSLMIAMLFLFVLLGSFAGFTSARLYKTFKGKEWQRCTIFTALFFPGICFSIFLVLNTLLWYYGSTGAVPFLTMIAILTLWFGISVPLVFLGAYLGYKMDPYEYPVVTSNIPRQVPAQPWYLQSFMTCLVGGVLPFGACFVELFFIMSSLWMDQYYYVFGFLLLAYIILLVTCAEIAIVLAYFQLCAEDYRWWWRSFLNSGSTALFVFLYSIAYFSRLEVNMNMTYVLYFGYMGVISFGVFLLTGAIGVFSCFCFNYAIYSSIKVD